MNKLIKELKTVQNQTFTENGAGAFKSTLNACLDAFGTLGAVREWSEDEVINCFKKAFHEDRETALRLLFYVRDVRGGLGERKTFRVLLTWLANEYPDIVEKEIWAGNILEYGRGDDLLCLLDTPIRKMVIDYIDAILAEDSRDARKGKPTSMLAKWLPSENASSPITKRYARIIRKGIDLTPKEYRQILSAIRKNLKIVETYMSANKWEDIDYEKVPAKAGMNYARAFYRHDEAGYEKYLDKVAEGEASINAKTLFPYEIVKKVMETNSTLDKKVANFLWESLPNYLEGKDETGICVVDTSGSMQGEPIQVAISLGLYHADKCRGPFHNHFITFSAYPYLQEVKGTTLAEKVDNMHNADWGCNTNLEAVFDLILETAKNADCSQADMPTKLYIISDMQFDEARDEHDYSWSPWNLQKNHNSPFMEIMKHKYTEAGYIMPTIVYWNVRSSHAGMFQDTFEGENCCFVSGNSPTLFKAVMEGTTYEEVTVVAEDGSEVIMTEQTVDPMEVMYKALYNPRYDRVVAFLQP